MTELGITQEYLLLAVTDRGRFSPLTPQQPICLVAAALGELTEAKAITRLAACMVPSPKPMMSIATNRKPP